MSVDNPIRDRRLWRVVTAPTNICVIPRGNREVLAYCEWLRLLVGRSLALAQRDSSGVRFEYLVFGVPLEQIPKHDEQAPAQVREAVRADFAVLKDLLKFHEEQVNTPRISSPERFLRSYELLEHLRLPEDAKHWHVTDEGLTIVQWGLADGRELFRWRVEHINKIESELMDRIDRELPAAAQVPASRSRSGSEEARSQREIVGRELKDRSATRYAPWLSGAGGGGGGAGDAPRVGLGSSVSTSPSNEGKAQSIREKLVSVQYWLNLLKIVACVLALLMIGGALGVLGVLWTKTPHSQKEAESGAAQENKAQEPPDSTSNRRDPSTSRSPTQAPDDSPKTPAGGRQRGSNTTEGSST